MTEIKGVAPRKSPIDRRSLIKAVGGATFCSVLPIAAPAVLSSPVAAQTPETRFLKLYQPHTDERFEAEFEVDGALLFDARMALNWFLRDHHTDIATRMDPAVFDLLYRMQGLYRRARGHTPWVNIHSAFRMRSTNENLRSEGSALNSYHLKGQAVDISVQGYGIHILANFAQRLGAGGLGIYWRGRFVHVDTGPTRFWYRR